jgi:hypothetical protein
MIPVSEIGCRVQDRQGRLPHTYYAFLMLRTQDDRLRRIDGVGNDTCIDSLGPGGPEVTEDRRDFLTALQNSAERIPHFVARNV